tara:strand:- start:2730 stop:4331 length:1602 start_codon:yes stop_codon:yes gene_type:complete
MGKKFANFGFLILVSLILTHCANRGTTSGGDKDETPPVIIKSVPENFSVNFDATEIKIYFDEYIKMKDLQKQLIVSPPMDPEPEITPLGTASKYITIRISDTLSPNTTYAFNFGESIADNNEGNLFPYYKYVFSTGSYIDSLSVSGIVNEAFNKKVDERIAVLLYEVDSTFTDSIIYKNKPKYIAVTDSVSGFKLENIKEGTYFLAALKEENSNYTFQSKTDKIGYRKRLITVPSDTAYVLRMFKESVDYKFNRARQVSHNKLSFGYEGDGQAMQIKLLSDAPEDFTSTLTKEKGKDTLNYWYRPKLEVDSLIFEITHLQSIDTAVVRIKDFKSDSLVFKSESSQLKLLEPYKLSATIPLGSIDETKVRVRDKDSLFQGASLVLDSFSNTVGLNFDKTEKNTYNIQILPGAFIDFYGAQNDTLNFKATTKLAADYGNLRINIRNGVYPLVVQVTDLKGVVIESYYAQDASPIDFKDVIPGTYLLRAIFDLNQNGLYDTGRYLSKTQPERVSYASEPIEVRAGWDTIEEFILDD